MIDVFVVEDQAMLRDGLRLMLNDAGNMRVAGEASNGFDAVVAISSIKPDVVVMDIRLPGMNGVDTSVQMHHFCPEMQFVFLTMYEDPTMILQAIAAGGLGFVLKGSSGNELIHAIREAYEGRPYRSERVKELMVEFMMDGSGLARRQDPLTPLSTREREVFFHVVRGNSNTEIARILQLSPKTVSTYRTRMMEKLGVSDLAELIRFAVRHGLFYDSSRPVD